MSRLRNRFGLTSGKIMPLFPVYFLGTLRILFLVIVSVFIAQVAMAGVETKETSPQKTLSLGEAMTQSIAYVPSLKIQEGLVRQAQAGIRQADGTFDWSVNSALTWDKQKTPGMALDPVTRSVLTTDSKLIEQKLATTLARQLHNGSSVALSHSWDRSHSQTMLDPVGTLVWDLTVTVPFLKGAGQEIATSGVRVAEAQALAVEYTAARQIENHIYTLAQAYWGCLSAQVNIESLQTTMDRAQATMKILESQVKAGEDAPVSLQRSQAEVKLREIQLLEGRQAHHRSCRQLSQLIKPGADVASVLPRLATSFPKPATDAAIQVLTEQVLIREALDRRLDLKSVRMNHKAATITLEKAENSLLPQLNGSVGAGYTNLRPYSGSGDFGRLHGDLTDYTGPNLEVGIQLTYPLGNNVAIGTLHSAREQVNNYQLQIQQLIDQIHAEAAIVLVRLQTSRQSFIQGTQSLTIMEGVAKDTRSKMAQGQATMTDLISVEERLSSDRMRLVTSNQEYANALAEMRLVTGSLAREENQTLTYQESNLFELPSFGQSPVKEKGTHP